MGDSSTSELGKDWAREIDPLHIFQLWKNRRRNFIREFQCDHFCRITSQIDRGDFRDKIARSEVPSLVIVHIKHCLHFVCALEKFAATGKPHARLRESDRHARLDRIDFYGSNRLRVLEKWTIQRFAFGATADCSEEQDQSTRLRLGINEIRLLNWKGDSDGVHGQRDSRLRRGDPIDFVDSLWLRLWSCWN